MSYPHIIELSITMIFNLLDRDPVIFVRVGVGYPPHLIAEFGLHFLEGRQERVGVGVVDAENDLLAALVEQGAKRILSLALVPSMRESASR